MQNVKMASWMMHPEIWCMLSDVSEELTASIIRAVIMEVLGSSEMSVKIYVTTEHLGRVVSTRAS
jgi:hypothetical protein